MRNFLALLLITVFAFSCSDNESGIEDQGTNIEEFPETTGVTATTSAVGDVIQINGTDFLVDGDYVVTFNGSQVGTIVEIAETFIKVEIPKNATSGAISLTFDGETQVVGTIEIEEAIKSRLFASGNDKIVELDIETGAEIKTILEGGYAYDVVFYEDADEIIFRMSNVEVVDGVIVLDEVIEEVPTNVIQEETDSEIVDIPVIVENEKTLKVNVNTGYVTVLNTTRYEDLIISNSQNRLFGYVAYDKIVEIDIETGDEIGTIAELGSVYANNFVFQEETGEIIFNQSVGAVIIDTDIETNDTTEIIDIPVIIEDNKTLKLNITTGGITILNTTDYEDLIISNVQNKLFAHVAYKEIVELDITTGSEIRSIFDLNENYHTNYVINEQENTIVCSDFTNSYQIDITTGVISTLSSVYYEDFIISNK